MSFVILFGFIIALAISGVIVLTASHLLQIHKDKVEHQREIEKEKEKQKTELFEDEDL